MSKLSRAARGALVVLGLVFSQGWLVSQAVDLNFAPVSGQVTSPFGWRTDPMTGGPRFHGGIDIAANSGTPVYAPQAGAVMFSGYYGGYGNVVVLNHGNSLYTLYGHNSQLLVKTGDTVYRGQVISQVGSTGRSTGPHLHFEVHYNQQYVNPVSYLATMQQAGPVLAQARQPVTNGASIAGSGNYKRVTINQAGGKRSGIRHNGGKSVQLVNGTDIETIDF